MKNQIQITETKKIIISLLFVLGAVTIFTAPLLHIFFPKIPDYQARFQKKIKVFDEIMGLEFCDLQEAFAQGEITPIDFIVRREQFEIDREVKRELLNFQLKSLIDKNRVFGWKSTRSFLIGFGIRLPFVLFSVIIFIFFLYSKDRLKEDENFYLYRAVKILYSMSFLISFYMTIWFILPRDLPKPLYHLLIGVLSISITICAVYGIKYYYNRKSNFVLIYKIKELIHFITKSRKTTLDMAITASEANPKLQKDIAYKLGQYDNELSATMKKVASEVRKEVEVEF